MVPPVLSPNEKENEGKARKQTQTREPMKRISTIIISLSLLLVPAHAAIGETASPWVRDAIALVNEERVRHGLPELSVSESLSRSASLKLSDMERERYFAHTSAAGKTPWSFFDAAGYGYRYAGENLAIHFKTPEAEHAAWMESERHCQNILDPRFREIGMAVRKVFMEGRETVLVVQHFGTRDGEATVGASGKERALAMCRKESVPAVSGVFRDGEEGSGRIALSLADIASGFRSIVPEEIRDGGLRDRMPEVSALSAFALAQVLLSIVSLRILLAREYEDGIYPS